MGNELYEALGLSDKDRTEMEVWFAAVEMSNDKLIEGIRSVGAAQADTFAIFMSLASMIRTTNDYANALGAAADLIHRAAFPREESVPL